MDPPVTDFIATEARFGARNYEPLGVVLSRGEGVWVWDTQGNRYLDCLSAYSAVNQGHCHPKILAAMVEQAGRLTLTSRAFHNDQLAPFYEEIADLTGSHKVLPMNSGAEAVESAIKAVRKWRRQGAGAGDHAEHRRLPGRADPGRGRRHHPAARLLCRGTRALYRARRDADPR
jgi:ornithine--oxo-acid transaminase